MLQEQHLPLHQRQPVQPRIDQGRNTNPSRCIRRNQCARPATERADDRSPPRCANAFPRGDPDQLEEPFGEDGLLPQTTGTPRQDEKDRSRHLGGGPGVPSPSQRGGVHHAEMPLDDDAQQPRVAVPSEGAQTLPIGRRRRFETRRSHPALTSRDKSSGGSVRMKRRTIGGQFQIESHHSTVLGFVYLDPLTSQTS